MPFRLTPILMTLDDFELYSLSSNFQIISRDVADFGPATAKRLKIGQYCHRHRRKHFEFEKFLACFRVPRVCQRQLGFLVLHFLLVKAVFCDIVEG